MISAKEGNYDWRKRTSRKMSLEVCKKSELLFFILFFVLNYFVVK